MYHIICTCRATVTRSKSMGVSVELARRQRTKCGRACTSVRSRLSRRVWKSCVSVEAGAEVAAGADGAPPSAPAATAAPPAVGDARNCAPAGPPAAASAWIIRNENVKHTALTTNRLLTILSSGRFCSACERHKLRSQEPLVLGEISFTLSSAPKRCVAKPNSQVLVSKAASNSSGTASRLASRKSLASYVTSPA